MPPFRNSDFKDHQPIIQWHAKGKPRLQKNFTTCAESIHLTGGKYR
jgi:hypothetical protein